MLLRRRPVLVRRQRRAALRTAVLMQDPALGDVFFDLEPAVAFLNLIGLGFVMGMLGHGGLRFGVGTRVVPA
ncbi:MAG TPA: hypothetical protein VGN14_19190 [Candidatus Elarobacter sp.]